MPGLDRTGPMGAGSMTGGGFGRCGGGGMGRGFGGRGQRNRWLQQAPAPMAVSPGADAAPVSAQLNRLTAALESIEARLARIEGERS